MSKFPVDILTNILCCLPVKSLLRFKCLSKPICSLIDSSHFMRLHLDHSISTGTNLSLVVDDVGPNGSTHLVDLDSQDKNVVEVLDHLSESSLDSMEDDSDEEYWAADCALFGSCNGLLALYDGIDGMLLWNPSTKKQQSIANFWGVVHHVETILDGFGYDVVHDDYKLVRIKRSVNEKSSKAMVYSLRANTFKTMNNCPYVYSGTNARRPGVYVGGNLNWVAFTEGEDDEDDAIIAFDLADESFHMVPQPNIDADHYATALGILGGCLAAGCFFFDLEVWVMKEYGIRESWTKLLFMSNAEQYIFEYRGVCTRPLYYSSEGKRVLLEHNSHYLFWYDLELKKIDDIHVFSGLPNRFRADILTRSLVPLPDHDIMEDSEEEQ